MSSQLQLTLHTTTFPEVRLLPAQHPLLLRATAPHGDGPYDWPGFAKWCELVDEAVREIEQERNR